MKELTRIKTEIYGYAADDGKVFTDKETCLAYESTKQFKVMTPYMRIVNFCMRECEVFDTGSEEFYYDFIMPKSVEDIQTINNALNFSVGDGYEIDDSRIGEEIVLTRNAGNFLTGYVTTADEIITAIIRRIDHARTFHEEYSYAL